MTRATVTPILAPQAPAPPPETLGVNIILSVADANELLSIIANVSPGGPNDGWVYTLYEGLKEALGHPRYSMTPNRKFSLQVTL